jgi:hypothetical protein
MMAEKDTISDALFVKDLSFRGATLYDGEDRNNLVTFAQAYRYPRQVEESLIFPI